MTGTDAQVKDAPPDEGGERDKKLGPLALVIIMAIVLAALLLILFGGALVQHASTTTTGTGTGGAVGAG